MQQRSEFVQLFGITDCVYLNATVVFVSDPSTQSDGGSILLDKPPETDALYPASDKPPASLNIRHGSGQAWGPWFPCFSTGLKAA
jgi:hypothetical protein